MSQNKLKILFFIGSLRSGGKERRLLELLTYLKPTAEISFLVVVTKDDVQYKSFFQLGIPYHVIPKTFKQYDPGIFYKFYAICKKYKPDIIHTWGRMQTLYALPAAIKQKISLCNCQITSGQKLKHNVLSHFIDKLNFHFSDIIITNSISGKDVYAPPIQKTRVIYNGLNMDRFNQLPTPEKVKSKYGLSTPYTVIMTASFTENKDYDLFYRVAEIVTRKNKLVSFIGVGGTGKNDAIYTRMLRLSANNPRIVFPGKIHDVEALVNASTIGVLFSPFGEGLSNAILEYMALGKPVIASNRGGNKELIRHNQNGYLLSTESDNEIADLILQLINDPDKCKMFGNLSTLIIDESFRLETMGEAFRQIYKTLLPARPITEKRSYLKISIPNPK